MLDTSLLPAHVLAFTQQLVGGNSNLEAKLQAVVPGVFGATGGIGQSSRRLVNLLLVHDTITDGYNLVATTLGSDGSRFFTYKKGEGGRYYVAEQPVDAERVVTEEYLEIHAAAKTACANFAYDAAYVSGQDDFWYEVSRRWDFNIYQESEDSGWHVSGYRVVDGVTNTGDCVWSAPLPELVAQEVRSYLPIQAGLEGGGSTS